MYRIRDRFHVNVLNLHILPTGVGGLFSGTTATEVCEELVEGKVILLPTVRADESPTRGADKARHVEVGLMLQALLGAKLSLADLGTHALNLW